MVSSELISEHIAWNKSIDQEGEGEVDGFVKKAIIHAGFFSLGCVATPFFGPLVHVATTGIGHFVAKKLDD